MTLPPQAYTRDILIKAYEWLSTQPDVLKQKAKDADTLVSLYMMSRRRATQDNWEEKVSAETFKNDLRHLAEDLKQFETPTMAPTPAPMPASPPQKSIPAAPLMPSIVEPQVTATVATTTAVTKPQGLNLDERSLRMVREIQDRFNLSSENEAIRMLIVLGYEKVRPLLPETPSTP